MPRVASDLFAGARLPERLFPAHVPQDLRVTAEVLARSLPEGGSALEVAGEILNTGLQDRAIPALELRILDEAGRLLERRLIQAGASTIPAGGRLAFATVALNPPPGAAGASVHLRPALLGGL